MPEVDVRDDREFAEFCRRVRGLTGIDLTSYKSGQMQRRVKSMGAREGATTFSDYASLLEANPQQLERFVDRVTINVSELFRNPEKFWELRDHVIAPLVKGSRSLRVWSAGCSYGAEIFSVAIMLELLQPGRADHLLGTDIDARILGRAQQGVFLGSDMRNVPSDVAGRFFTKTGDDEWSLSPEIRRRVHFRRQDLLRDPFEHGFHVILCRNVVIYFTDDAKDKLYERFFQALVPGGTLFVGGTERILKSREIGFETFRPFFYRRPV